MKIYKLIATSLIYIFIYNGAVHLEDATKENEKTEEKENISSNMKQFENQIAGHAGIMKDSEGFLLKYAKYPREFDFFESLENTSVPELLELKQFVPKYNGSQYITTEEKNESLLYMRIEDITKGTVMPCVIDFKMGKQIWEPTFPEHKIALAKSRYTEMRETFEFCIQGFQYHDLINGELVKHGINYQMKVEQGLEYIYDFINGEIGVKSGLVDRIVEQLQEIYSWFRKQTLFHFYSCSVLIVYEAQNLTNSENPDVRVRLIDFAHVVPNIIEGEKDENFIGGLERLIAVFQNFLPEKGVTKSLPAYLKSVEIQVTDSVFTEKGNKIGLLRDSKGSFLIPSPACNEISFHNILETKQDPILEELRQYVPSYLGIEEIEINNEVVRFLKLENTAKDFKLASSINMRLGLIGKPCGCPESITHKLKYVATKQKLGFGISGFIYHNVTDKTVVQKGIELGYRMLPREAIQWLYKFVNGEIGIECGLVDSILEEIRKIRSWFEKQRHFRFYDSSILITYDTDSLTDSSCKKKELKENDDKNVECICKNFKAAVKVSMLKFDKVLLARTNKEDEDYLFGLQSLISTLENLTELYAKTLEYKRGYPVPLA